MSKHTNTLINALKFIFGGVMGFFVVYYFEYLSRQSRTQMFDFKWTIILTIVTILIVLVLGSLMIKQLHQARKYKQLTVDEEERADQYDSLFNRTFYNTSISYYTGLIISLINLILATALKSEDMGWQFSVIPFIILSIFITYYQSYIPKIDDRFPKGNDKNYMDKLINIMDEGERHITFGVLFKLFHFNISALVIIIIVLSIYTAMTGDNQTLALIILMGLLLFNIFFYYSKVKKYYK
ncbi:MULTISPECIES: DUF3169 family protein [Staphylococcus]|uniref:DUF3169 family protein n=1 Tax=Staphylococcus TaxID=1279 RepID=UPI0021D1A89E|nr:DUF3169 family protein [Staphylococcus sp. IVB6181]UXV35568.1 DUF3169 family protein [Staphylococcus sp. IVB6181]